MAIFESVMNDDDVKINKHSRYEVPILMDVYGLTPLDYSLGLTEHLSEMNNFYKILSSEQMKAIRDRKTPQLAEIIFDGIKDYRFNSVGPAMVPSIVRAVKEGVSTVLDFLDNRLKNGQFIDVSSMHPIKQEYLQETEAIGEYGSMVVGSFEFKKVLHGMFEKEGLMQPMQYQYFDVPQIFGQNNHGVSFIAALCAQKDVKIFSHESIQMLV